MGKLRPEISSLSPKVMKLFNKRFMGKKGNETYHVRKLFVEALIGVIIFPF